MGNIVPKDDLLLVGKDIDEPNVDLVDLSKIIKNKEDLDKKLELIINNPNFGELIEILVNEFKDKTKYTEEEIRYISKYVVGTNSKEDIKLLIQNMGHLCANSECAYCCKTKENIILTNSEFNRVPIEYEQFFKPYGSAHMCIKHVEPCSFLSNEKKCLIYKDRPSGCKGYPIIDINGKANIARDPKCRAVREFLKVKFELFIQLLNLDIDKIREMDELEGE